MGFIRGSLLILVGFLLFVSLLGVNSLFIVSSSLSYENVNSQIKSVVLEKDLLSSLIGNAVPDLPDDANLDDLNLTSEQEEDVRVFIEEKCENRTEYVFSYEEYTVNIPCDSFERGGAQAVVNETIDGIIEDVYYDEYNCDYWDCFTQEETPLFLLSEKSKDYWQEKMNFMLIISLVLLGLTFFLVENKENFPVVFGGILIISALPLLAIENLILSLFGSFASFFTAILTNINLIFWFSLVFGLILIGIGITLKVVGMEKIKGIFNK